MKANQSKSFYKTRNSVRDRAFFADAGGMRPSAKAHNEQVITLEALVGHFIWALSKLFVVIKFLIFHLVVRPVRQWPTPILKLSFLSLAVFFIIKKDFKISIHTGGDKTALTKDEVRKPDNDESWFGNVLATAIPERKKVDLESEKNPFAPANTDGLNEQQTKAYVRRYAKVAVTEMHRYGIPASIKIAQGIIESRNGESTLSKKNNNHFGIKCFSKNCKKGHCSNFSDDHHKDFFRKYDTAWESWRAHSILLSTGKYKELVGQNRDYRTWAYGLKKMGYATDKSYDQKLIDTIEKYKLFLLDEL